MKNTSTKLSANSFTPPVSIVALDTLHLFLFIVDNIYIF